jgi:hypothetical protein
LATVFERHLSADRPGLLACPRPPALAGGPRSTNCASDATSLPSASSASVVRRGARFSASNRRHTGPTALPPACCTLTGRWDASREVSRFGVPFGVCGPRRTVRRRPTCEPFRYDVRLSALAPKRRPTRVLAVFSASRLRCLQFRALETPPRAGHSRPVSSAAHVPDPAGPFSRLGRTRGNPTPATPLGFSSFPSQC